MDILSNWAACLIVLKYFDEYGSSNDTMEEPFLQGAGGLLPAFPNPI